MITIKNQIIPPMIGRIMLVLMLGLVETNANRAIPTKIRAIVIGLSIILSGMGW